MPSWQLELQGLNQGQQLQSDSKHKGRQSCPGQDEAVVPHLLIVLVSESVKVWLSGRPSGRYSRDLDPEGQALKVDCTVPTCTDCP